MEKKPFVYIEETIGTPPDKKGIEQTLITVADKIVKDTTFKFIDTETGETYDESTNLPVKTTIKLQSGYNDWKYWNGVIHNAMHELAKTFDKPEYSKYSAKCYDFSFKNLTYFKKLYDAEFHYADFHQYFRMDRLDDCGAMGAGLLDTYNYNKNEQYIRRIEQTADHIFNKQERLEDGTFIRIRFNKTTLWADDLFMSIPFLGRMAIYSGNDAYMDDAVNQIINFNKRLYNSNNGLFYHTWCKEINQYGVAYWGRANGWVAMAQAQLISLLPENHPKRQELIDYLFRQIVGASRYQSAEGLWHQLLDKTDSFLESSSTSMFVYAIAKAVNEGWIDDMYSSIAISGWEALKKCISVEGELDKVSLGFNIKQDLPFYYTRPIEEGGAHGLGAFLLAGIEVYKLKPFRDCVWC